tara:strand:- start:4664 stop:5278 length:615 start_codon:yes stop_codon:yes gene_type:complete
MDDHVSPEAGFDTLVVLEYLGKRYGGVSYAELHLFCYLSCLLALFKGRPVSEWGYGFAGTQEGAPFSPKVDQIVRLYCSVGFVANMDGSALALSEIGRAELTDLRTIDSNTVREECLEAACTCAFAMPIGLVQLALGEEPELRRVRRIRATSRLLEETGLIQLHEHFAALGEVVGVEVSDLLVPAHIWLSYLSSVHRQRLSGSK